MAVAAHEFPDPHLMTVAEVAEVLRVSKMTVYRMIHADQLKAVKFGRSYRVPAGNVREYLRSGGVPDEPDQAPPGPDAH